ncbi:MAG: Crp/Fnr family transcriptional regulator [Rhodobacterales bacterium]|nr:Crp/Fnr family transcriptional regulator [Rhodobacterales bacterium]
MYRDEGLQILAGQGWLAGTSEEFRELFLPMARWRRFAAGTVVTLGGEEADDIIGMASGVMAFTSALGQPDTPVMHLARAVYWMGYGPILLGGARVVSAEARSEVWVASFPKARLLPLLDDTTGWWRYFIRLVGEYGNMSATIASDLLIPESERRCAAVLLRFGGCQGAVTAPVLVPVTQGEFAASANLSRNSAGKILRGWAAQGLVETGYGGITIVDPAGLRTVMERPLAR